jgi:hypothetical protein
VGRIVVNQRRSYLCISKVINAVRTARTRARVACRNVNIDVDRIREKIFKLRHCEVKCVVYVGEVIPGSQERCVVKRCIDDQAVCVRYAHSKPEREDQPDSDFQFDGFSHNSIACPIFSTDTLLSIRNLPQSNADHEQCRWFGHRSVETGQVRPKSAKKLDAVFDGIG